MTGASRQRFAARVLGFRALLLAGALSNLGMKPPAPHEYGRVVLDNFSSAAGVPPVGFDHFRHRAKFTCRLCHVDIGFAMASAETNISASTNRSHYHCGACHDGTKHGDEATFPSCSASRNLDESPACRRCHVRKDSARLQKEYETLTAALPRSPGGEVDWEAAEAQGRIRPIDFLKGISISRRALKMDRDISIESKASWMTDVRFSHKKHAVWNGCEVCHPEIFPAMQRGAASYTMLQISSGEYCGVCHTKVAFPLAYCERCHVKPVR